MSQINGNPTLQDVSDLGKAIKYNTSYDTIETNSSINSSSSINCSNLNCSNLNAGSGIYTTSVTSPIINTSSIYSVPGASVKMASTLHISGDLILETPVSYAHFYENMMKAVYDRTEEKDLEFCMPSNRSKLFLGRLINHMNDQDAVKCLRALYLTLSQMPSDSEHLPSGPITTAILEFSIKENL
jgi:hypothetical protein